MKTKLNISKKTIAADKLSKVTGGKKTDGCAPPPIPTNDCG